MTPAELKSYFKPQLDSAAVCSGDYLDGVPLDEAKKNFLNFRGTVTKPLIGDDVQFDVDAFFARRIKQWKEHAGERIVFYMIERPGDPHRLEVLKCWESEIDLLAHSYDFVRFAANGAMVIVKESVKEKDDK